MGSGKWCCGLVVLLLGAHPALALDTPEVSARAEIDHSLYGKTGRLVIRLEFRSSGPFPERYRVLLHLADPDDGRIVVESDHVPPVPTDRWEAGKPVLYTIRTVVPAGADGARPSVILLVGIVNPLAEEENGRLPLSGSAPFADRRYLLGLVPAAAPPTGVDELREDARRMAKAGDSGSAFTLLEEALELSSDLTEKVEITRELLALEPPPPGPITGRDRVMVEAAVAREKIRWLRDRASGFLGRKEYRLALQVMRRIGGVAEEERNTKVIGEPTTAERVQRDMVDVRSRFLRSYSEEDLKEANAVIEGAGEKPDRIVKAARTALRQGRLFLCRRLLVEARLHPKADLDLKGEVAELIDQVEDRLINDLTPEEKRRLEGEMDHPSFHRLDVTASRKFVFVGPKGLVNSIPRDSSHRLDVAAVLLKDLFGQYPVSPGERIVIHFNETHPRPGPAIGWVIIVAESKYTERGRRVDNGWWYHELTHCVEHVRPVHDYKRGLIEGLANLGSLYVRDMFAGERGRFLDLAKGGRDAFARFHLARRSPYWLILPYEPSEGLLTEILARHALRTDGHADWPKLARAFRIFNASQVKSSERPMIMAYLGHALAKSMGPGVWDTLAEFGFPVTRETGYEIDALAAGAQKTINELAEDRDVTGLMNLARAHGYGLIASRARYAALGLLEARGAAESVLAEEIRRQLGVIYRCRVVGPFHSPGAPVLETAFPPEWEIEFEKEYPGPYAKARWVIPERDAPHYAHLDARGVVYFELPYKDWSATYVLAQVSVPEDTDAIAWVGEDDESALWVNDVHVERSYGTRGVCPDTERWPIRLRAGRNKLLLKVVNHQGRTGFSLRVVAADGAPIPGLLTHLDQPPPRAAEPAVKWSTKFRDEYRRRSLGKSYVVTGGQFRIRSKVLRGQADGRRPDWRPFSKAAGFPKDYPAALLWLRQAREEGQTDFRWRVVLGEQRVPKICLTWDGEGGDVAQSGWSLIMWAQGNGGLARIERYDYLYYQKVFEVPAKWSAPYIEVKRVAGEVSVHVGGVPVFDRVSAPPLPLRRFGMAVWGTEPSLTGMVLDFPRK